MWARAFVATGGVAAPIGLHLGWNVVAYVVFSVGPLGPALLASEWRERLTAPDEHLRRASSDSSWTT